MTAVAEPVTIERFWSHVDLSAGPFGCWPWTGKTTAKGYGQFWLHGQWVRAHRVGYAIQVCEPGDLHVLHRCDNPPCCNWRHLFLGTNADNQADMRAKGRGTAPPPSRRGRPMPSTPKKLTADQVAAIRADGRSQRAIAAEFGISQPMVGKIKRGVAWAR